MPNFFKKKFFAALGLLLWTGASHIDAQTKPGEPILYSITEQNGLSDNSVTCFFQDSRGFMWIGTKDGLNFYDGSSISIFRSSGDSLHGLANNSITAITEDVYHNIWIGTSNGISRYNVRNGQINSWRVDGHGNNVEINLISCMHATPDGNIWLGSSNGLLRFDPKTEQFTVFSNTSEQRKKIARSDNFIVNMLVDSKQRFWLGTYNGLWQFFPGDGHFEQWLSGKVLQPDSLISALFEDHDGKYWLGIWSGGLQQFHPESRTVENLNCCSKNSTVLSMAEIKDPKGKNHLYFAPELKEFNGASQPVTEYLSPDIRQKNFRVFSLYASRDNLLWLATDDGIRILDPAKQVFHHQILSDSILSPQGVVLYQQGRRVFVGAAGMHALDEYDSAFHLVKKWLPGFSVNQSGKKVNPAVLNIAAEDSGHLWLGTEKGLYLFDEKKRTGKFYTIDPSLNPSPTANFINRIFIDSRKTHWVFPWRSGIWQLDPVSGKFKKIFNGFLTKFNNPKRLVISDAAEDMLGNIWFADLDEGVIRYDHTTGQFSKPAEKILGPEFSLQNILFEEPFIWFVASGKIFRMDAATMKWDQWDIPAAFNKAVSGFCLDSAGHLWITTINGLLSFDKNSHEFKRFTRDDGLLSNGMHEGSLLTMKNGKMLYAAENYMTSFDPAELLKPSATAPVMITGVLSQNRNVSIDTTGGSKKISLDYTYNNFTFRWALPNYSNPLQNQYYCKLEGVDKGWKYVGNKGEAQYASLQPGSYTFEARAAAGNGLMSKNEDKVTIVIEPPFWRQWWFIVSTVLAISGLLYLLYRYRVQQVIRLERLRSRISSDLHDDIGSTLSSISIISELAMQENSQDSRLLIKEIKDNSISLMEKMDDIVWSINPKNDSLENLMLRVKAFASRLFEAKNIDYRITIRENVQQVKLPMEYRQHIYLIMKESINNIVKYAKATQVSIDVSYSDSQLEVKIEDNGTGFDPEHVSRGNGIINMKSRAAMMRARLSIRSTGRQGTAIDLIVKIK